MIISRTPFRISFFGGGTDFPAFFQTHGGAVLSTTLDRYCYLCLHRLTPFFKHRFRASYSKTESVLSPQDFEHPLIRETLVLLNQQEGIEISHIADLPGQTGLGSSSAFTVGLLNALHAFHGVNATPEQLAREAICVERERVGDAGGWQDQYAAAFGGFNCIRFQENGQVMVRPISLRPDVLAHLSASLQLFYLGVEGSAEDILTTQNDRVAQNKCALQTMYEMVEHAIALLEDGRDLDAFGRLLEQSWQAKKSLSSGITNPVIDDAYDTARRAGALGGKLLGAGGRGFLCIYAPPERHAAIQQKLAPFSSVPFGFSMTGSQIVFNSHE